MRPNWHQYFMKFAVLASERATCLRNRVGVAIVIGRQLIATGYNGSIRGEPHCEDIGCQVENGHCTRTSHAELNAIAQAAQYGISTSGATMYCTIKPCLNCFRIIVNAGIQTIYWKEVYQDDELPEIQGVLAEQLK